MSGSGGFFKYRCKYFYTHDCPNWVFVNYAPCAECCAAGRDDPDRHDALPARLLEIAVPVLRDGVLHYTRTRVAIHAMPGAAFVAWQLLDSSDSDPVPPQQPMPQPLPYDDHADMDQHHTLPHDIMHSDRDDDHLYAQLRPPPPPQAYLHPPPPRQQQQQQPLPLPLPLHGDDDHDALPPPYSGPYGSYSGFQY